MAPALVEPHDSHVLVFLDDVDDKIVARWDALVFKFNFAQL